MIKLFEDFNEFDPFGEEITGNPFLFKIDLITISPLPKKLENHRDLIVKEIEETIKSLVDNESEYGQYRMKTREELLVKYPNNRNLIRSNERSDEIKKQLYDNYILIIKKDSVELISNLEIELEGFEKSHVKDLIWRESIKELIEAFNYRVWKKKMYTKGEYFEEIHNILFIMSKNSNISIK